MLMNSGTGRLCLPDKLTNGSLHQRSYILRHSICENGQPVSWNKNKRIRERNVKNVLRNTPPFNQCCFTISELKTICESGPLIMAKILRDQYQSVFTTPQYGPHKLHEMSKVKLTSILFTPKDVFEAFKAICISLAPGSDGVF